MPTSQSADSRRPGSRLSADASANGFLLPSKPPDQEAWMDRGATSLNDRCDPILTTQLWGGFLSEYARKDPAVDCRSGSGQLTRVPFESQAFGVSTSRTSAYGSLVQTTAPASRSSYGESPQTVSNPYDRKSSPQMDSHPKDCWEDISTRRCTTTLIGSREDERRSKRNRGGRDEFEGSIQYLEKPRWNNPEYREQDLPLLPIHLDPREQHDVLQHVNMRLSQCAFDFVAAYRFPIPLEPNKPAVQTASDKEWTEWAYLLKRLATKRKIPSHAVYNSQIKDLTTVLDNSLEMPHTTKPRERQIKDDRNVLQFISAGIQVGKILKDAETMEFLDKLYQRTEKIIQNRSGT